MNKKCDEFLEAVKNLPFESRTYLELACALEDSKKELEAKDKLINTLREFITFQECSKWRSNMLKAIELLNDKV